MAQRYLNGLAQADEATFAAMAAVVEDGCEQQFQHFISSAPWRHEPVVERIARDADRLPGGKPTSALIIDESRFVKQGDHSVGVARQWCGRLGKIDSCQGAVFSVLTDGARHVPGDMRLYLPQRSIEDPHRCDLAGIPVKARRLRSKSELALEMVRAARARGMRFAWVGVDAAMARSLPSCARWTMQARALSPMFMARSGSGPNRRDCTSPPRKALGVRQASSRYPSTPSRWRSWLRNCVRKTEAAASCATARAARCGSTSRSGGSGCGTVRKRRRGAGI
jgi:hypothetical protein